MRDFFRKSLAPLSQIRKTKGLAGKESRLEVYVSEELSLRVREENHRQAFRGETSADSIAAVVEREPDWKALPPATPAGIRRLLQRCLEKDANRRLHDIADARIEIEDALATP